MNREYHAWYSDRLARHMELLIFGHAGPVALVFPTSQGRFYEFEDRGLVGAFADRIDSGTLQLVCVDSVDSESWYHVGAFPGDRVRRHLTYESYICDEVLPLARARLDGDDRRVTTLGFSLGAFHAALFALRHPWLFNRLIAVSGTYDNAKFIDGYHDTETYLTNPLAFIPGLHDHLILESMRSMAISIVTGSTDPHIEEARTLSRMLWEKAVANDLDVWDGWMHDWPFWQDMLRKHL